MLFDLLRHADDVRDFRKASAIVPGLPGSGKAKRGATKTRLITPAESLTPSGQSNVRMKRLQGGGVAIEMQHRTRFAPLLDEGDLAGFRDIGDDMVGHAENLSQGNLSARDLRRRGHPFGRNESGLQRGKMGRGYAKGVRGAVPGLTIVNRQSGEFAKSWRYEVTLNEFGVLERLINDSPHAAQLAFGTRRMQAHGPFALVVAASQARRKGEWQRVIYRATRRKQLESDVAFSLGLL